MTQASTAPCDAYPSLAFGRVEARPRLDLVLLGPVPSSEESTAKWVELVERYSELAQAWEQLGLDVPVDRVIDALVRRGLYVSILPTDVYHLGNFPGHVVANSETLELAFLVEVVDSFESFFEGSGTVGAMEVPHLDRAKMKGEYDSIQ